MYIIQENILVQRGKDTIILSGVNISHDNTIGKSCFVVGGATVGAYTAVGDYVFIGQGVLTISDKVDTIGHHSFIGAGSLVTKSITENMSVAGRPAKPLPKKDGKTEAAGRASFISFFFSLTEILIKRPFPNTYTPLNECLIYLKSNIVDL